MVELLESGEAHSWVRFQHFDYSHSTTFGYMLPSTILKLFESDYGYRHNNFNKLFQEEEKRNPSLSFMRWQQLEITPEFWQHIFRSELIDFLNQKWTSFAKNNSIGKSSLHSEQALLDGSRKTVWAVNVMHAVMMDPSSRKPKALPENLKQFLESKGHYSVLNYKRSFSDQCKAKYDPPEGAKTFLRSSSISTCQTDFNGHTNQSAYMDLCFNCLAETVPTGFCSNMTESIFKYPVRRCSLLYLKESKLGDKVDTIVWQDVSNQWVFHFHIMKNNEVICQTQVEFCTIEDIARKLKSKL